MNTKDRIEHIRKLIVEERLDIITPELDELIDDCQFFIPKYLLDDVKNLLKEVKSLSEIDPEESFEVRAGILLKLKYFLFEIEFLANSESEKYSSPIEADEEWYSDSPMECPLEYPAHDKINENLEDEPDTNYKNNSLSSGG